MALTAAFTCSQEQVTGQPRFSRVVLFVLEVRVYSHSVDPCGIVLRQFTGVRPLRNRKVRAGAVIHAF